MLPSVQKQTLNAKERVERYLTYDEYRALPDDGIRYEVIKGTLFMTPAPMSKHQRISRNLEFTIYQHVKKTKQGVVYDAPVDIILANDTVLQPDIVYVRRERAHLISKRGIEGAPDIVIEILSPSTQRVDRTTKMKLYAEFGVQEYWLVDPEVETFEVFTLQGEKYLLSAALSGQEIYESSYIEGLKVSLDELFAEDFA